MGLPFSTLVIDQARAVPLAEALRRFKLDFQVDESYVSQQYPDSRLFLVNLDGQVRRIVITGPKWFDLDTGFGQGGAIDLGIYLLKAPFARVVRFLIPPQPKKKRYADEQERYYNPYDL